jgi:hypothetical protein
MTTFIEIVVTIPRDRNATFDPAIIPTGKKPSKTSL